MVIGDMGAADVVGEYRHPEGRVQRSCRIGAEDPPREKRIANQVAGRSERFAVQAQKSTLIEARQCHEPGRPEVRQQP